MRDHYPGSSQLTDDEHDLMTHLSRWGSDGYPIQCVHSGRPRWGWQYRSLSSPVLYRTRKEAVAAFEAYHDTLRDVLAGRISRT